MPTSTPIKTVSSAPRSSSATSPSVSSAPFCADFDIDLGNPLEDVDGFVVHMGELALGGDTNHLELHDALDTGAMKPFLYYTVV